MYIVICEEKVKAVFWYCLASTGVFYLTSLYWILFVGPMGLGAYPALVILCCYFAFIYAASFAAAKYLDKKVGIDFIFSLPVIITLAEYAREWLFSGWPVLTPAQSQHQFIPVLQILSITGVSGLNFLIISVNCLLASFAAGRGFKYKKRENIIWSIIFIVLLAATVAANSYHNTGTKIIRAAVMQPNIDQNVQWTPEYRKYTMDAMKTLYNEIAVNKPDLIIWPETGYPGTLNLEKNGGIEISSWIKGVFAVVGSDKAVINGGAPDYYNAAFMVNPQGKITGEYSKHHLVPFGEYIPLQEVIPFVKKVVQRYGFTGFKSGTKIDPFDFAGMKIGPIICFDSFFPEISREHALKGAKALVHLSYETWYGVSPASAQIFSNAVLRAVENRLPIIRSVASGISGIINDRGEILETTGLFEKKAFVYELKINEDKQMSFYTMHGDWFAWLLFAVFCGVAAAKSIKP
jgi:apolipoprotein N-acyltransferase